MADANLIKGAGFAARSYIGQPAQGSGAAAVMQASQEADVEMNYRKQLKKQAEAKMGSYIDNMPANVDIEKVPQSMRGDVNKWLINARNEFFENAKLASSNSPDSPIYMEAVDKMNSITQSFSNLNADFERLKELKYQAIEDFDNGMISNGNKPEDIDFIANITTDQVPFGIGETGRLVYGEGATLDDVPKYHYKDHDTATKILDLSNQLYQSGAPMDKGREQMVKMQLQQQIKKGGRDAVLSMATDDHIIPGGLGIQDVDLLENPERQEELEQFVINSYMNVLKESAQSGYQAVIAKENRADSRSISRSISLAEKKKAAGLTTASDMTAAELRQVDAKDRSDLGREYMNEVMNGNTKPLIGAKYVNETVLNATYMGGGGGSSAVDALSKIGYSKSDINDFLESEYSPGDILIITDKDYYVVDPYDESTQKDLTSAIIQSKFGNDATTDAAIMNVEKNKPVLPVINVGPQSTPGSLGPVQ